jgi:signal transduction histidine kinase
MHAKLKLRFIHLTRSIMLCVLVSLSNATSGQDKSHIQIKTFDQQLNPIANIEVAINENNFTSIDNKGVGFIELPDKELPPKKITVKHEGMEAESWNYSKGVLEIIIRTKSYNIVSIHVLTSEKKPVKNVNVTFYGNEIITTKTNNQGIFEIPVAINEKILSKDQFNIKAYHVIKMALNEKNKSLIVEPVKANATRNPDGKYFQNFNLKDLDSIQSLTVFYAVFKNYPIASLDDDMKRKIDAKFIQLMDQQRTTGSKVNFIGKISDSSLVSNDIQSLLEQAHAENKALIQWRKGFDEKIKLINNKLENGIDNMGTEARKKVLTEIQQLEIVLQENEKKFYKNLTDYRVILGTLKNKLFEIGSLEEKLYQSELQRHSDRELFQKRLSTVIILTSAFSLLAIGFIYFNIRLKRQQGKLIQANEQVRKMNETLESLVEERTKSLKLANEEMDVFLYRASHDLRGPIVSILGICNLASHIKDPQAKELFEKTSQTAFKMDRVLKKLQLINEINHPRDYATINLTSKIQELQKLFAERIREYNISMIIDAPENLTLNSYPKLIEIILINLMENALFYSGFKRGEHSEIKFSAHRENGHVQLSVNDNGIGIDNKVINSIWDMFYIGDEHSKGNGLGLYVTLKSVKALKGNISVKSEKNIYTQFTISIPVK